MKKENEIIFGNRIASLIAFLWVILFIVSCKLAQTPVVTVPVLRQERIVEKLIPVVNPADSANIVALFECDEERQVILKQLSEEKSSRMESQFTFNSGQLKYKTQTKPQIVYLPSKDSIIYQDVPIKVNVPFEVNKVTGWQWTQIYAGRLLLGLSLLFGVYKLLKLKSVI